MDERLKQYLQNKYADQLGSINTAQAFANLGDVIAGQKVGTTSPFFSEQRGMAREQTLGELERQDALEMKRQMLMEKQRSDEENRALRQMQILQQGDIAKSNLEQKKFMAEQAKEQRQVKEKELSTAQAKQLGLAKMGSLANKQYEEAIKQGFQPTSYTSKLDFATWAPQFMKSDEGKKAVAAQDLWVENYLRDASGAAIPQSERSSYAEIYFPRPGDTPDIIQNKEQMRQQKEEIALIGAGPKASEFKKPEMTQQSQPQTKIINGKTYIKTQGGWKASK